MKWVAIGTTVILTSYSLAPATAAEAGPAGAEEVQSVVVTVSRIKFKPEDSTSATKLEWLIE